MASRALRISGSGTVWTSSLLRPIQQLALISALPALGPPRLLRDQAAGPGALRAALGPDHLARLQHLLEAAQVVGDLLPRLLAEQPGDGVADRPGRRLVRQFDAHLGAAPARRRAEPDDP